MVQQHRAPSVVKAKRRAMALAPLAAVAVCLTACASGPPDGPRGEEAEPPRRPGPAVLFISPAGEPFRGQPGEPYPVQIWFRQADANGDGALDRSEFAADAERFFHRLDRNNDGVLDGEKVRAYETQVVPEIAMGIMTLGEAEGGSISIMKAVYQGPMGGGGMGGGGMGGRSGGGRGGGPPDGPPGGGPPGGPRQQPLQGAAPYNFLREPEPVAAADLDFKGRITLANFRRRADQRFDILDTEHEGRLTLAALPKTAVQQAGEGRRRGGRGRPRES